MSQATPAKSGSDRAPYTGRKRRATRGSVKIIDTLAKYIICTGGIAVTLAFVGIVAFIFYVVVPLFGGARLTALPATRLAQPASASVELADKKAAPPLAMGMDENLASVWVIDGQGKLTTYRAAGGELLKTLSLSKQPLTTISNNRGDIAIGLADGSVIVGRVSQSFNYVDPKLLPPSLGSLRPGADRRFQGRRGRDDRLEPSSRGQHRGGNERAAQDRRFAISHPAGGLPVYRPVRSPHGHS